MDYKLFDAERRFMDIIWDTEPINSTELSKLALPALGWKKSTTYNMIRRLAERGYVKNENATVTALITREQVGSYESVELLEKNFGGSVPAFFASFLKDRKLTEAEIAALKRMIEEAKS